MFPLWLDDHLSWSSGRLIGAWEALWRARYIEEREYPEFIDLGGEG